MQACLCRSIKSLRASEDGLDIKTLRSYTYSHDYITAVLTSAQAFYGYVYVLACAADAWK